MKMYKMLEQKNGTAHLSIPKNAPLRQINKKAKELLRFQFVDAGNALIYVALNYRSPVVSPQQVINEFIKSMMKAVYPMKLSFDDMDAFIHLALITNFDQYEAECKFIQNQVKHGKSGMTDYLASIGVIPVKGKNRKTRHARKVPKSVVMGRVDIAESE